MTIAWPSVYTTILRRLDIFQFKFLTLPTTACATPNTSLYNLMNGITLSCTALLVYIAAMWVLGRVIMSARRWKPERVTQFDRYVVRRVMDVLTFAYTPIVSVVLAMFSCRTILDQRYLRQDMAQMCDSALYKSYRRGAIFWTILYVIGIPVTFLLLLSYYRVPQVARELKSTGRLRALMELAHRRGISQPGVENGHLHVTVASITEEHIDALYRGFIVKKQAVGGMPEAGHLSDAVKASAELDAADKLALLLQFAARHVEPHMMSWADAAGDARLAGAEETIGSLYKEFAAAAWYWSLSETLLKLLITGVLTFIAPGRVGQVVAGLFITFAFLLGYQRVQPYEDKTYRRIGFYQAVTLYLFFVFALLVKADIDTMTSAAATAAFNDACLGILTCATFAVPVVLVALRLRWALDQGEQTDVSKACLEDSAAAPEEAAAVAS